MELNPNQLIRSEAELRSYFPPTHDIAIKKVLDHIDEHARSYIKRSPFICIGTQSADGTADVSPRGDPAGFVHILDERTLLIPDRPGNNRLDTLSNILSCPNVGILFIVPGFEDTLRINGTAQVTCDPKLLEASVVHGNLPKVGIVVTVNEVFLHCAKAFRRSKLWNVDSQQDRSELPSLVNIVLDQTSGAPSDPVERAKLDEDLEEEYRKTMY